MNPNEWRFPQFTKRFRELRGKRDNTEFAKFLGISRQTVGFYYNGDRIPDAMMLKQIAEKCGVSTDYLLGLTDTQSTNADAQKAIAYTKLSERTINLIHSDSVFGQNFRTLVGLLAELDNSAFLAAALLDFVDKAKTAIFEFKRLVNGDALIGENGPDELDEAVSRKRYDTERAFTYMLDELLKRENYPEFLDAVTKNISDEPNHECMRTAILANLERVRSGEEVCDNG